MLTLTAGITTAVAQENKTDLREKCMFGVKAGLNHSNVYDSNGEAFRTNPKLGTAAGVFLAIPLGVYAGLQPEVLYSQRRFQATGTILGSSYYLTRTSSYVDFPILFAFKPSEFITVLAGPQYSYLVRQKDEFKNASTTIAQESEFENENVRKNTLCFTGGIDLTMKHLVIGARAGIDAQYNHGDGSSTTPRYKNAWFQATIGYRFYTLTEKD
ncbi:MAG: hypothetical protein K0S12_190 [Bacteroidetes bacterium]|jgi:hypothetical protein|nr:hypothetical protein [Bacteroidota bacterium]